MEPRDKGFAWVSLVLLAIVLLVAACGSSAEPTIAPAQPPAEAKEPEAPQEGGAFPSEMPSAVRGKAIYEANCVACHGAAGNGSALAGAANFTDVGFMRHQKPAEFYEMISAGVAGTAMPGWAGTLSSMEIWDVLYYAWAFASPSAEVAAGQELFAANCVACHGEAGDGSALAGATNFTDQAFMSGEDPAEFFEKINEGIEGTAMPAWGESLSEGEIWALVSYVWTFAYEYGQ